MKEKIIQDQKILKINEKEDKTINKLKTHKYYLKQKQKKFSAFFYQILKPSKNYIIFNFLTKFIVHLTIKAKKNIESNCINKKLKIVLKQAEC